MSPSSWTQFPGWWFISSLIFQVTSLILLSTASAQNTFSGTVTITNLPIFSSQRQCAQDCFGDGELDANEMDIGVQLSCPYPLENACFCRADLTSSALYLISSCVNPKCNYDSLDLQTALDLYSTYCDVTAPPITVTAGSGPSPAGTVTVTPTVAPSSTESLSAGSSPSSESTLSATSVTPTETPSSTESLTASSSSSSESPSSATSSLISQPSSATPGVQQNNSDSFWTKTQGIVAIVSIIVASLLAILGLFLACGYWQRHAH